MGFMQQAILYGLLLLAFWGGLFLMQMFASVELPDRYNDIDNIPDSRSYSVDRTVPLSRLQVGNGVAYKIGGDDGDVAVGWIAALPGQMVSVRSSKLFVDDKECQVGSAIALLPDCGAVIVPSGHFFVISNMHKLDSFARGPIPVGAIIGQIGSLR